MNIQCQQCGTSYAVADDKVRGRLMKVRCKSCSEPIRVDGTLLDNTPARPSLASAPPGFHAAPAHSAPPVGVLERPDAEGATWHIAVGDSTQGPYTLDELREHYQSGAVMLDTLVYCEGSEGDWRPAGEIPELQVPAAHGGFASNVSLNPPAPSQTGALAFSSGVSMGSDPFGERRAAERSQGPRVSAAEMFDGAPKEQTVQFSIDQIRALSSVSAQSPQSAGQAPMMNSRASASVYPPRMSSSTAGGYGSSGYAGGDGSGLIDVRKLAELHLAMTQQETSAALSEPLLPASGSYAHTLAPLSLPLPPAGVARGGIDGRTKLVAGLAAFGMVLAAAVGVLALTRPPVQATAAIQPPTEGTAAGAQPIGAQAEQAAPEAVAEGDQGDQGDQGDKAEPTPAEADNDEAEPRTASASSARGKKAKRGAGSAAKRADKEPSDDVLDEPAPSKPAKSNAKNDIDDLLAGAPSKTSKSATAGQSIDDLLDNAVSGKKAAPKAEEKPAASGLPMTPGRDEMLSALNKAKAKAAKCKGPGVATAAIQISGSSGKATNVSVSGVEGAAGTCVEKAVRSTSFPKFQKDKFEVKFPFKLGA